MASGGRSDRIPSVAVVVPCYNYGHFLEAAVSSALDQEGVETRVIIVDDASPDGSGEVARTLAERDPRVTAIVHEQNKRHIATYNDGLRRARGDYVVLLSADDLLAPGALAQATSIMERNPKVGLVYGYAPDFVDVPPPPPTAAPRSRVWRGSAWASAVARSGQNPVSTPTAVMRRSVLEATNFYDARLPHTADLLMWLRAASLADVAYVSGTSLAYYRTHGANMHTTDFGALDTDLHERLEAFKVWASEGPGRERDLAAATRAVGVEGSRAQGRKAGSAARATVAALTGKADFRYWRRYGLRLGLRW